VATWNISVKMGHNIMDFEGTVWEGMEWINFAQDREQL
jgi:hypothetical protein